MKFASHPLVAFSVVGAPFVLYSIYRTGFDLGQLVDNRLLVTVYVWPIVLLTSVLVGMMDLHRRGYRLLPFLISFLAAGVFVGVQFLAEFPFDYKLGIYIVAPTFVWCSLFALSFALLSLRFMGSGNAEPDRLRATAGSRSDS